MGRYDDWDYPPYVSVAEKKERNAEMAAKLARKNANLKPVVITGRKIANTFWGKAWCDNVESYQDYENRLPRGRSYVRSGAVIDLQIATGKVTALVAGSARSPYKISIEIKPLANARWETLKQKCVGKIASLLALAQGKLPGEILEEFCDRETGLFPSPKEIKTDCSCPDWAELCKHLAAVLYGIGARLDEDPKLFFTLRGIDENELVGTDVVDTLTAGVASEIAPENLEHVFGMEFDSLADAVPANVPVPKTRPAAGKETRSAVEWTPERIRALRMERGLSQAEFGKLCGTTQPIISQWERGVSRVNPAFYKTLNGLVKPEKRAAHPRKEESLTEIRNRLGLSRPGLGKLLGVSAAVVGNRERGITPIPPEQMRKLERLVQK